jgi:transcription termination/antitermination protein NusA
VSLKITYDMQLMAFMSAFTNTTGVTPKDCFYDSFNQLTFIVPEGEMGRALGKQGRNAKYIERGLNRKIKIVEFNPDVLQFVRNVVYPIETRHLEQQDKQVMIEAVDSRSRGLLIGRAAQNLRNFESIVKRYFDITELRVM